MSFALKDETVGSGRSCSLPRSTSPEILDRIATDLKSPRKLLTVCIVAFQVVDEPLFIVHHIDVMISMSGTNVVQTFREALIPSPNQQTRQNPETGKIEVRQFPIILH